MSYWTYFSATWRNCRRESLRYRLSTAHLAGKMRVVAGPEPTWAP